MALDPWAEDASAGAPAYSGQELRLSTVTPFVVGAGASLGVRSGVRLSGSATDLLVQAQSSPNMTVKVNPGVCVAQGSISTTQGAYTWALDAVTNVTIAASHATLDRIDLICVRIRDASVDTSGARDGAVIAITGTNGGGVPSLPTDATYLTIAQISVVHAVTSITSGVITDKRVFTAAPGGFIQCTSTTRPSSPIFGQRIWETDSGFEYRWNGAKWMRDPCRVLATQTSWTSNTTPSAVTGMSIAMEANSKYAVDMLVMVFGIQNVGVALSLQIPTGTVFDGSSQGWRYNDGVYIFWNVNGATSPAGLSSFGYTGAVNRSAVIVRGTLTTSSTAGNVVLFGAQQASNASASYVDAQSWMELKQLA